MIIFKPVCSELIIVNKILAQLCDFLSFSFHFIKLISAFLSAPCSSNFVCSIMGLLFRYQGWENFRGKQTASKNQDFARCERKICFKDNCFKNGGGTWFMPNCISLSASHFNGYTCCLEAFIPTQLEVLLSHSDLIWAFYPRDNHKI